jgi:hypothetical protein
MDAYMIKKTFIALSAAAALTLSGVATAQESGSNNLMMGFNPFGLSFGGFGVSSSQVTASAPSYIVGMRTSDQLMPFGYVSIADNGGNTDTIFGIGGGARFYLDNISQNVRPFAGASAGIINAADTGFGIGGFFGAEAMITKAISISGQVGLEIADDGSANSDTNFQLGTANVMFNLYF